MDTPSTSPPTPPDSGDDSSKKYIRTFASDMEIVRRGGTPNLTPVEPTPAPAVVAAVPPPVSKPVAPPPPPPPPPAPKPLPPPPVPVFIPPPPLPEPPPPPPPAPVRPVPVSEPEPLPAQVPEINASPLQTYAGDFLDRVKATNASEASILAAEEDAGTVKEAPPETSRWKTVLSIVGGVVLLIVGGGGVYLGYAKYLVKTAPVVLAPVISSPIFVDETVRLSAGTSDALLSEIQQSIANPPALSSVRLLYTDLATTTGNDVFSRLQFSAPAVLLRNIKSRESMAGIVNMAGTPSPFFILSVTSYPDTFGGMLSWEPRMPEDISALFPSFAPTPPPVMQVSVLATTSTTTTATTTSKQSNVTSSKTKGKVIQKVATSTPPVPLPPLPPRPAFHDEVISNHDVRVYRDSEGRSVFMYGYWDKTTLVIARDVVAFTEILRRLSTSLSR